MGVITDECLTADSSTHGPRGLRDVNEMWSPALREEQGRGPKEPAFREHPSGLLVPNELSRQREVWTKKELRLIGRVTKLMASRNMQIMFACRSPQCADTKIERVRGLAGDFVLRCQCKDRVFQRAF